MTNHITNRLLMAIDNLKCKYPKAFAGDENVKLESVVPKNDPDLAVRNDFLAKVKQGDKKKRDSLLSDDKLVGYIDQYMTMTKIGQITGLGRKVVAQNIKTSPQLKKRYEKRQAEFQKIVLLDVKTNKLQTYKQISSVVSATGAFASEISFLLKMRDDHPLLHDRYKLKRKVWYDEDGGF